MTTAIITTATRTAAALVPAMMATIAKQKLISNLLIKKKSEVYQLRLWMCGWACFLVAVNLYRNSEKSN